MSTLSSHNMLEHGMCAEGILVGNAISEVVSSLFASCNTSSMAAKCISWILHTALCIILLAINSVSLVPLLTHKLQQVFETARQKKWKSNFRDKLSIPTILHYTHIQYRLNVKGRVSDISSKHFSSSELQSYVSRRKCEDLLMFLCS